MPRLDASCLPLIMELISRN